MMLIAVTGAAAGLFLGFQYPVEIPGVSNVQFLRTALNAQRRARGEDEIAAPAFLKLAKEKAAALKIDFEMLKRGLNVFMFSDNVPVAQELALKRLAEKKGLLMMGPDCGTAIIDRVPLAFANRIPAGPIAVVG